MVPAFLRNSAMQMSLFQVFRSCLHAGYMPLKMILPITSTHFRECLSFLFSVCSRIIFVFILMQFTTCIFSTVTPFQTKKTWHNNRELGTQYLSKGSPVAYWRKRNNFSLLNPALQRPSTVKIASPDVTMNRTFTL